MPTVSAPPMYAAFLTPQGRFLCDLFLYRPARAGEKLDSIGSGPGSDNGGSVELLADVDSSVLDELLQTFKRCDFLIFKFLFTKMWLVATPLVEAGKERREENYLLWRIENGVAEDSTEIQKEVEQRVAPSSDVIDTGSGKKVGPVTTALGCRGLGLCDWKKHLKRQVLRPYKVRKMSRLRLLDQNGGQLNGFQSINSIVQLLGMLT
ncbi:hypothetical protein GH714_009531 [Hevea brasiliensis]|uniref:Uncharacterized protein n=1 Tax=Hevea brasiliensis TaxID=3981 RepID=A0A6A6MJL0_HEVBR|nr:hypothetical protein GH714_009531 [Hevea brasiliensis]